MSVSEAGLDRFTDGQWHRLHPATPLLRGGIGLAAVLLWLAANLRERIAAWVFGYDDGGDPLDALGRHHLFGVAAIVVVVVLAVGIGAFWLSWRASSFRIDGDAVSVRHGVLLRTTRTAKLDRIQGVTISRPVVARVFGAARIELDVAGQHANVRLEYLSNTGAEELRREVLRLASGKRAAERRDGQEPAEEAILDESGPRIVAVTPGRALGSVLLSDSTLTLLVVVVAVGVLAGSAGGGPLAAVSLVPFVLGAVTLTARRAGRALRYSVVATRDGVRVASGLVSTRTEALPPGRVHAVQVDQPLLWRPAGWWRVSVNRAGHEAGRRDRSADRTLAPVATTAEVLALVPQLVPDLADDPAVLLDGLTGRGGDGGFTPAPRRARWLRPISWRRTGFRTTRGSVLARAGRLRRELTIVPQARVQSVSLRQGLLERGLDVVTVHPHVVAGPVRTRLHLVDTRRAEALFAELAAAGAGARAADVSHRWAERA